MRAGRTYARARKYVGVYIWLEIFTVDLWAQSYMRIIVPFLLHFFIFVQNIVILKGKFCCILHLILLLTAFAKCYFLSIVYCSASRANLFSVKAKMCSYVYSSCAVDCKEILYVTKWIMWKIKRKHFPQ
jgi:hypothetical protein